MVSNTIKITFASNSFIFLKCENNTFGIALTNDSSGNVSIPDIPKKQHDVSNRLICKAK